MKTGPVERLSSVPASSNLTAAPCASASGFGEVVAGAEHAERTNAIANSAGTVMFTASCAANGNASTRIAGTVPAARPAGDQRAINKRNGGRGEGFGPRGSRYRTVMVACPRVSWGFLRL